MGREKGTLNVRNFNQKVLMECELQGQISDGYWENSYPLDHWMLWSRADVVINPDNVGRSFPSFRTYKFDAQKLLSVVKARMIVYVRLANTLEMNNDPQNLESTLRQLEDMFETINGGDYLSEISFIGIPEYAQKGADEGNEFWMKRVAFYNGFLSDPDKVELLKECAGSIYDKNKYNIADLKKDLKDLNEIQYIRIA